MHYYKSNNEIMQYCSFSNDIALIMHYRALLKGSGLYVPICNACTQYVSEYINKTNQGRLLDV